MGESANASASANAGTSAPSTGTNWVGNSTTAIGGLTTAWGQFSAGRANQRLARINAADARRQAAESLQAGQFASNRVLSQQGQEQGAMKAAQAGGGTVVGAGTSGIAQASARAGSNMDRLLIQLNARRQAYGYQSKAALARYEGDQATRAGALSGLQTIMGAGNKLWENSAKADDLTKGPVGYGGGQNLEGVDGPETLLNTGDDAWQNADHQNQLRFA